MLTTTIKNTTRNYQFNDSVSPITPTIQLTTSNDYNQLIAHTDYFAS